MNNLDKTRRGLGNMAVVALSTIKLEEVEGWLQCILNTATDSTQTQPVAKWLSEVRDLVKRVEVELEKKLAWLDKEKVVTVAQKPPARTGQARPIVQRGNQKVSHTISQMVERGRENKPSAKPGHPMDEFREVLNRPEPQNPDERPKHWREVRKAVGDVLLSPAQLGEEDWELLFRKLRENLYTLPFEADKTFFLTADRGRVLDLLFGEKNRGEGAVNALLHTLENAERMQGGDIRSCYVILSCLEKVNDVPGNRAATEWAALIARQVARLNGPPDLIAAFEAVKVPPKTQDETAAQPRQSARRQPLPKRKFHSVHGDPDLEVDPKDLQKVQAAAKVSNNPFAAALEGVKVNRNGNGKEAAEVVAQ